MSTWRPIRPLPLWKRLLPACLHGPVKLVFIMAAACLAVLGALSLYYMMLAARYDLDEVAMLPAGMVFYDRKGIEIPAPGITGNRLATREDIPDFLVKALLAREDARFFSHHGVDLRGLVRATIRNIKDRDFTQGASTLSMQLARNTYEIREKSLNRKFLEIAITLRLENHYDKDEILTHYLNRIYYGAGAYGIEQAARTYFGKPAREMSLGECALIAGIIRGPHVFSPSRRPEAALEQRRQTLHRMAAMGFITAGQCDAMSDEPLKLAGEDSFSNQTSYVLKAVERELDLILEDRDINLGGIQVHTTLDAAWQQRLENELNHAVRALEAEKSWPHPSHQNHTAEGWPDYVQFAAVTLETRTGAVLAWIGGRDFGHSRYDRTRSKRDLGSAFEPFVAAAAAERGKLVLPGKPVQTGRQIGPAEVQRLARRCGISGPFVNTEDLFRGAVAATPMEMSVGLATLGNDGKRPRPFLVREIRDANGKLLHSAKSDLTQALGSQAAKEATSVLQRSRDTRTFTGATGSERDAWMLRLGPSGSTAIWIGFDKPTAIAPDKRLQSLLDEFVKRLDNR